MRILITTIVHYLDSPGGSSKIAFEEAVELARLGHDVWVLAYCEESLPEHELVEGVHLLRYRTQPLASWNPMRASAHQRAARTVLARYLPQVDAIHGHIPLTGLAALKFYGRSTPSSYTIHSPVSMEMSINWRASRGFRKWIAPIGLAMLSRIEGECLRRSDGLTALSKYTIDCVSRIHGKEIAAKVQLIPGWVDTNCFSPAADRESAKRKLGWRTDTPVLFTLRRLRPRMGLDRLLEAVGLLVQEGCRFHLYLGGKGPLREKLEAQARALGIGDSVSFLGRVSELELPLAYAACDAFVLPTAELECFGIIALEALSAGRTILATPVGAIPEIVERFEPSWLAKGAEAQDIADLIRRFLAGELPSSAAAELHERVDREYSRERVLSRFLESTVLLRQRNAAKAD
jgi:glycosyltransferase involved in cell wall biosynthesis